VLDEVVLVLGLETGTEVNVDTEVVMKTVDPTAFVELVGSVSEYQRKR